MFGSILVLASSVARAASKYHLLLRDPHFSVIAILVSSTGDQGGTFKGRSRKSAHRISQRFLARIIIQRIAREIGYLYSATSFPSRPRVYNVQIEKRSRSTFAYNHFTPRYCYILTAGQQVARSRLGPFTSSFKNLSIRGEDSRLNFMR